MITTVSLRKGHDVGYFTAGYGATGCAGAMACEARSGDRLLILVPAAPARPPLGSAAAGTSRQAPGVAGLGCLLVEGERLLGPPGPS
jgi:hypothetical protein